MVDIFPFIEPSDDLGGAEDELPMAKEYAWDFEKEDFKRRDGRLYTVEGKEAVKIWLWKLFKTPRYRHLIYSWDYGNELEDLIGRGYTQNYINAEAKGYIKEAIEYNLPGYVTDIQNISVTFSDGVLTAEITVDTPYGEVDLVA